MKQSEMFFHQCTLHKEQAEENYKPWAQLQSYNIIGVSETCWEESSDCCAVVDDYILSRRDRQSRRGREVALYLTEGPNCMELSVGGETVESLSQDDNTDYSLRN